MLGSAGLVIPSLPFPLLQLSPLKNVLHFLMLVLTARIMAGEEQRLPAAEEATSARLRSQQLHRSPGHSPENEWEGGKTGQQINF